MRCKNCNQIVDGNFCSHCGQKVKVDKINLPNFLNEVSDTIFQINRGLFYTMKELFVRPGYCIREYLSGKRKNHYKPIAYAFTLSAIYFLISQLSGSDTFVNDFISGYSNSSNSPETNANQLPIFNWFAENYPLTMLLLIPIFSLASYLSYFKSGFNYLEHFVLNSYITGQQAIIYSLFAIISLVTSNSDLLVYLTILFSTAYAFFTFWQFFSEQSRTSVILRFLLTYTIYLFTLLLLLFLLLFFALKISPVNTP